MFPTSIQPGLHNVWFQKLSIPPPRKGFFPRPHLTSREIPVKLHTSGVSTPFYGGSMDIFWNYTILKRPWIPEEVLEESLIKILISGANPVYNTDTSVMWQLGCSLWWVLALILWKIISQSKKEISYFCCSIYIELPLFVCLEFTFGPLWKADNKFLLSWLEISFLTDKIHTDRVLFKHLQIDLSILTLNYLPLWRFSCVRDTGCRDTEYVMTVICFGWAAIFSISLRRADHLALHGKYLGKNITFCNRKMYN